MDIFARCGKLTPVQEGRIGSRKTQLSVLIMKSVQKEIISRVDSQHYATIYTGCLFVVE